MDKDNNDSGDGNDSDDDDDGSDGYLPGIGCSKTQNETSERSESLKLKLKRAMEKSETKKWRWLI